MRQTMAMAWKEWHETRVFLWIGLGMFLGLPVIAGAEGMFQYSRRFEIAASPWVTWLGGVLAVVIAVGATCRDFRGHLEDFWHSRPVSVGRWLSVKYVVGFLVVLAACMVPLGLEVEFNRDNSAAWMLVWFPFLLVAVYSIGFVAGCVVRRAAHAAMLGLAGMLLLLFLPVVLPPLEFLDTSNALVDFGKGTLDLVLPRWEFACGMVGIAVVAGIAAIVAVARGWHVESGPRMMYGSIGLAVLILFASAAFQLGTNMPVLQEVGLPAGEHAVTIKMMGDRGFVITREFVPSFGEEGRPPLWRYRPIEMRSGGIELGNPVVVSQWAEVTSPFAALAPGRLDVAYGLEAVPTAAGNEQSVALCVNDLHGSRRFATLWNSDWPTLYVWKNRLYVIGERLAVFDIGDAAHPKSILSVPFGYSADDRFFAQGLDRAEILLPPVQGLPARQRLEAALRFFKQGLEGDTLCVATERGLFLYRLTKLTDKVAVFEKAGESKRSVLEGLFGQGWWRGISLVNGLAYTSQEVSWNPGRFELSTQLADMSSINPHISVYDTRGAEPMRLIGHFAAPGVEMVYPLPDGRAIVGGTKLWLVGAPPRRGN